MGLSFCTILHFSVFALSTSVIACECWYRWTWEACGQALLLPPLLFAKHSSCVSYLSSFALLPPLRLAPFFLPISSPTAAPHLSSNHRGRVWNCCGAWTYGLIRGPALPFFCFALPPSCSPSLPHVLPPFPSFFHSPYHILFLSFIHSRCHSCFLFLFILPIHMLKDMSIDIRYDILFFSSPFRVVLYLFRVVATYPRPTCHSRCLSIEWRMVGLVCLFWR